MTGPAWPRDNTQGTEAYPEEKSYKAFLAQHGGASNASTSMLHTSYHFSCLATALPEATHRLAQFFVAPLITADAVRTPTLSVSRDTAGVARDDGEVDEPAQGK